MIMPIGMEAGGSPCSHSIDQDGGGSALSKYVFQVTLDFILKAIWGEKE